MLFAQNKAAKTHKVPATYEILLLAALKIFAHLDVS